MLTQAEDLRMQGIELAMQRMAIAMETMGKNTLKQAMYKEIPAYCTLRDAARLKGITTYENLIKKPWHQPCCGRGFTKINGKRCWSRADVIRWLDVTDETLEQYAASCGVDISQHFKDGENL